MRPQKIYARNTISNNYVFSLVLGTKNCLGMDDLRVLEISEKHRRLTKSVVE